MEAHVVAAVTGADDAADHMLARMLLHMIEPSLPVDFTADGLPHRQRLIASVEDNAFLFPYVGDGGIAQHAKVGGLAAALGIKGGAVQRHQPAVFILLTGLHHGGEFL